ncbi:hypothetical protein R3Q08_26530 [Rhodococcus erythropolis]|uniref:hypothetical protein n=1 Tax=Rhodococcus erythropolis TaxID=1833 RepID=UPI00294A993D|nr:hypothetical protein [Rhodococcus erythropolis]MDV6211827.1 hypothetical protein [Rhodococcus erythropolis]
MATFRPEASRIASFGSSVYIAVAGAQPSPKALMMRVIRQQRPDPVPRGESTVVTAAMG